MSPDPSPIGPNLDPYATQPPPTDPFETVIGQATPSVDPYETTISHSSTATSTPPPRIAHYELIREIARGGMGVVHLARDTKLDRIVALKLIKAGELADDDAIERFQVEAKAAAQLDHPGIVPVYEVGEFQGQHFMAMAFIDGGSLAKEVQTSPLPPKRAAQLMEQVATAVHFAHTHGIVHRDLKPQNILLTKDGQPKVTDFGLAKRQGNDSGLTQTGLALGTPSYMPPEQAKGDIQHIGPLADVYSLGATLYCLLTGRPPFQASNPIDTMLQVLEQDPLPPRRLNPSISKDLETICLKCLQKVQGQRYASAVALADDLRRYQRGEPILARPVSIIERGWRWCRRNPMVTGLTTATVLLLVSVVTVYIISSQREVRSLAISAYVTALDNGLQRSDWTTDHLRELDEVLDKLARLDPDKAKASRDRVNSEFAADLDRRARQPRLSEDDLAQLNSLIEVLASRDANLASPIQQLLTMRRSAWQPVVEWRGESTGWDTAFNAGSVQFDDSRLIATPSAAAETKPGDLFTAPRVMLLTESGPNVQCEVQFESPGEDVVDLGLELNTVGASSYGFRVQRTAERRAAADELGSSKLEQPALVQICRDGRVLRQTEIDGAKLLGQPVRVRAKRQGTLLTLQINDTTSIELDDPFPLPVGQTGHVAVRWPAGSGVTKFVVSRLHRATEASPLETADALFSAGKFQEALQHYRDQAAASGTTEYGREARYKQAVCLLELKQADDAFALWQQFAAEEIDQWTALAEIQLWALLLERSDIEGAEEMLRRLELKFRAEELTRLIPDDLRNRLIASTASLVAASENLNSFLLLGPKAHKRLSMARECLRLIGSNPSADSPLNRLYNDTLVFAGNFRAAKLHAFELIQEAPWLYFYGFRAMRYLGQNLEALQHLESVEQQPWSRFPGRPEVDPNFVYYKLQVLAALERWPEWDELSAAFLKSASPEFEDALLHPDKNLSTKWQQSNAHVYATIKAMQGFRLEQQGLTEEARLAWKDAARAETIVPDHFAGFRTRHIIATLAELDRRPMCERYIDQHILVLSGSNDMKKTAFQLVSRETLIAVLMEMWSTPRGRDQARRTIFESLTFYEDVFLAQRLMGFEYLRQVVFDRHFDNEQDELVWSLGSEIHDLAIQGHVTGPLALSAALVWKGTTGVFGWNAIASNFAPPMRAKLAYVLAHRYRKLNRPDDAAKLFQSAIDADPDSLAAKLAARDLAAQK